MTSSDAEASARRYLRLFPEWMRDVRGEEVLGLVLDQVPAGATSLPLRSKADLVRAGLHARRRGTPPLRVWSTVASGGRGLRRPPTVPLEWRPWLVTRIPKRGFAWQCALVADGWLWPYSMILALNLTRGPSAVDLAIGIVVALVLMVFSGAWFLAIRRKAWRERLLAANGLGEDGRPLPPDQVTVSWRPPAFQNVWVRPFAAAAAAGTAVGPITWLAMAEAPLDGFRPVSWTIAACALVVLAIVAWTRAHLRGVGQQPAGGEGPPTRRADLLLASVFGVAAGAGIAFCVAMVGMMAALQPAIVLAPIAGALAGVGMVLTVERAVGRPLGSWDLLPGQRPQQFVQRLDELPPPPRGPDKPAFG